MRHGHHDLPPIAGVTASKYILLSAGFVVLGLGALVIDRPVSAWFLTTHVPGDLRKPLEIAEGLGHGIGVLMILLAVYTLDPRHRWALPRVAATAFGAGLAANIAKTLVGRTRPRAFDFSGGVWETFSGLFPLGTGGNANQSFPSAHAATIVGLAFALTWLYPRGRWLFAGMAVMVALQRIQCMAHYLSDTLFGAALGCLAAVACMKLGPLCHWFDRHEPQWKV